MGLINENVGLSALFLVLRKSVPDVVKDKEHRLCFQIAVQVTNIVCYKAVLRIDIGLIVEVFCRAVYIHINGDYELVFHFLRHIFGFFLHTFKECTEGRHILRIKSFQHSRLCVCFLHTAVNKGLFLCVKRVLCIHTRNE